MIEMSSCHKFNLVALLALFHALCYKVEMFLENIWPYFLLLLKGRHLLFFLKEI